MSDWILEMPFIYLVKNKSEPNCLSVFAVTMSHDKTQNLFELVVQGNSKKNQEIAKNRRIKYYICIPSSIGSFVSSYLKQLELFTSANRVVKQIVNPACCQLVLQCKSNALNHKEF